MQAQAPGLSDYDLYLLGEGKDLRSYEKMGAHFGELAGRRGVHFAVWAPNANQVSVVGDFNSWDSQANLIEAHGKTGVWEGFVPDLQQGARYKYHIASQHQGYEVDKADPYAFAAEIRPHTASRVWGLSTYTWADTGWMENRATKTDWIAPYPSMKSILARGRESNRRETVG